MGKITDNGWWMVRKESYGQMSLSLSCFSKLKDDGGGVIFPDYLQKLTAAKLQSFWLISSF